MTKFFKSNIFVYIFVVIMVGIMATLLIKNARDDSVTTDEPIHILSGYEYWQGNYNVNPEHPPLGKQITTLPLELIIKPTLPINSQFESAISDYYYDSWAETRSYAQNFLYNTSGNDPDKIVFAARLMVVFATILFSVALFVITKKWFGKTAAMVTIFLFCLSPIILTHGHLANTDMWMTIGYFSVIFSYAWLLENPKISRIIIATIIFSTALLLKFSAVLLVPVLGLLWLAKYYYSKKDQKYSWYNFIKTMFVFLIVSLLFIWADYGFPMHFAPKLIHNTDYSYTNIPLQTLAPILQHLPTPIYFKGLIMVFSSTLSYRSAFILGHSFLTGVWYYFPFAFLVKEPLSFLILLFGGIFYWISDKRKLEFRDWILIIPVFVYSIASVISKLNIGIRHLMPIYPFIFIFIGYFVSDFFVRYKNISKNLILTSYSLLTFLLAWYIYANISIYPNYMTYFNELAGGPKNGANLLSDSNIDWGQDMKRLASWLNEQNITEPIKMEYFWSGYNQPEYYKINFIQLEQNDSSQIGWIVIGASALQNPEFDWLKKYQSIKIIGNSLYVYHLE